MSAGSYYSDPNVVSRLFDFRGGLTLNEGTATFITFESSTPYDWYSTQPISALTSFSKTGSRLHVLAGMTSRC
ncbi:MAG: hypothetical protein JNL18_02930 [Planctomycetaceae bacterium]|uniref:Uncharacterized protein n=1 Tax=Lacipirellula limnantheis TaxID=2528024 RepID=A0A517TYT9_9BACT|nr:hypothetical protein [Planctomycetaceae bacterium]QDT73531.1 hypothetical protein I41_27200 [Lacipirellula limnantheis]